MDEIKKNWNNFHEALKDLKERKLARLALEYLNKEGATIVDIGAGSGNDSLYFLKNGHKVIAIDKYTDFIENKVNMLDDSLKKNIDVINADFRHVNVPPCDMIYLSLTLSFCKGIEFFDMWNNITKNLVSGNIVCCDLFGEKDGWYPDEEKYFYKEDDFEKLFSDFKIEVLKNMEFEGQAVGTNGDFTNKHWNKWTVIVTKI